MKREFKILILVILFIIFIGITYYLYKSSRLPISIVTGTISLLLFVSSISLFLRKDTDEGNYEFRLKKILRTYDAILVQSNNFPSFRGKNIIHVLGMNDLIDAQAEVRKPIYYMKQQESTAFLLMNNDDALIYVLKMRENVVSPIEILIKEAEKLAKQETVDEELLNEIDKTTIVKLPNKKVYKVSPVRKKKKDNKQEKAIPPIENLEEENVELLD